MERPTSETIAWYESVVPIDTRVVRGQMFGHPCAFVNGHMFLGTFAQSLVVRVGTERAAELVSKGSAKMFEPMENRPWREYVQFAKGGVTPELLAECATAALDATAALPPKPAKKVKAEKAAPTKQKATSLGKKKAAT